MTDEQRLSAHRSILQQEYDKSLAEGRAVDSRVLAELIELSTGKQRPGGGRMADEWLPAWNTYASASLIEKAIGIGAGRPFTTADGQLRTYIHNFPLYVLLYQGAIGLVLWVVRGAQLATTLFQRFRNNRDWPAIAMLVLWLALQFYGLTFAVHKLISFNLLLLAVYLMALGLVNDRLMPSADADEKSAAS